MNSATSTDSRANAPQSGFQPWQVFVLLAMAAATWGVVASRDTHPAALLLLSAAIIACGFAAAALYRALSAFFGGDVAAERGPLTGRSRAVVEADKALVLRSLKELEFDKAMGKISTADFTEIGGRLRNRALTLMEELELGVQAEVRAKAAAPAVVVTASLHVCAQCHTGNDRDARFCKHCGAGLA